MARKRRGRGEGSIYKVKGRDLWAASIRFGFGQRRKIIYGKTKAEVQDKLRQAQIAGPSADVDRLSVGEFLTRWLEGPAKRNLRESTHTRYEQLIRCRIVPKLGKCALQKLTPAHVDAFFVELDRDGVSARGAQMAGNVLGRALKDAVGLRLIATNPVRDVVKPKPKKREPVVWNMEQVQAFLKASRAERLHCLFVVAVATGARSGELFALKWADCDLEGGSLFIRSNLLELKGVLSEQELKTAKSRRRIELPPFVVRAMLDHRDRMGQEGHASRLVFCDEQGGYLRRPNVARRSFQPLMKAAGLPRIRFHDLRHVAASLLLLAGVHPKIVSERLGHASIELTLNTYSHVMPTMQKHASDKLEGMFGAEWPHNGHTDGQNGVG